MGLWWQLYLVVQEIVLEGEIVSVGGDGLAVQRLQTLEPTNVVLTSCLGQSKWPPPVLDILGYPPEAVRAIAESN